jgi:hypothetical protein
MSCDCGVDFAVPDTVDTNVLMQRRDAAANIAVQVSALYAAGRVWLETCDGCVVAVCRDGRRTILDGIPSASAERRVNMTRLRDAMVRFDTLVGPPLIRATLIYAMRRSSSIASGSRRFLLEHGLKSVAVAAHGVSHAD